MISRTEYVVDGTGWELAERLAAAAQAVGAVAQVVTRAETDIPWHKRDAWPREVADAAAVLRDRFVSVGSRDEAYLQTGVQPVDDDPTREAFTAFAPYAHDCTLWGAKGEVASLSDEGASVVVSLTHDEAARLRPLVGSDRLVPLAEWRRRHPSVAVRLLRRLTGRS